MRDEFRLPPIVKVHVDVLGEHSLAISFLSMAKRAIRRAVESLPFSDRGGTGFDRILAVNFYLRNLGFDTGFPFASREPAAQNRAQRRHSSRHHVLRLSRNLMRPCFARITPRDHAPDEAYSFSLCAHSESRDKARSFFARCIYLVKGDFDVWSCV